MSGLMEVSSSLIEYGAEVSMTNVTLLLSLSTIVAGFFSFGH
jgi:hypothetical protein